MSNCKKWQVLCYSILLLDLKLTFTYMYVAQYSLVLHCLQLYESEHTWRTTCSIQISIKFRKYKVFLCVAPNVNNLTDLPLQDESIQIFHS